jgi:hypothetical protein
VLATKTNYTTLTYFTTLVDKSQTVTVTRTKIKSTVVTETYSGQGVDNGPSKLFKLH